MTLFTAFIIWPGILSSFLPYMEFVYHLTSNWYSWLSQCVLIRCWEQSRNHEIASATVWWTRDQPERSSADLVIDGLPGKLRGYRMDKMAIRKQPQMKIDHKLQQLMQICCGKLKFIIMTMTHVGVCAVRRGIDVKTKNGLHTQGLEVVKSG